MTLPPLPFRRTVIAATSMLAGMIVLWWGVWSVGAAQYRTFIDDWIETHRATGYQLTYDARDTEGFPRWISLHFTNFVLQDPDGIKIHANDVSLSTFPWQWHRFNAKLKHGFELTIPFTGEKTLFISTAATVRNHTELQENGDWQYVDLELLSAKALWGAEPFFSAGKFKIALDRPATTLKDYKEPGLTAEGAADDLTLPSGLDSPFGPHVAKIEATLRIMGPPPDPRKKESVAAWNGAGGVVEFDKFFLAWGPLILETRGTLGLDDDLQAEGAFSGQIGNHNEVLKTLMAHNYIPKREAGMLNSALNLFAKKAAVGGTAGIEVPITVQLQGMFLGPVHVFEFPEIKWDTAQPQPVAPTAPAEAAPPAATAAPTPITPPSPTQ